ncbi:helix-turn-helix transcriptional regulator [Saccharopolyspora cebuensis]|uniref:Helix-turn-helix domain-containing protein n=1 Tax=Saccharopolyspora cebuensis TaxID=418759 RepID=A0ABV4CJQ0_9PSEU
MARTSGGSPKARVVGAELRKAREEAGMGVRELARRLGTDHSKLSRCEGGQTAATPEFVASVLTALGVPEVERDRVAAIARGAERTNWLAPVVPGAHHELTTLIEFERSAQRITEVATLVVPGLLQTADYARAVMAGVPLAELETRVTLRIGRRDVLNRRGAPQFDVLVMELGLRNVIGGKDVMAEQLRQMQNMAARPNISIRVIPDSEEWNPAHAGSYLLFEFSSSAPIVHLEHYSSAAFLHEADDTEAYHSATDTLRQLALNEEQSSELIAEVAEEMENKE